MELVNTLLLDYYYPGLDFDENFVNIFNKTICLACTSSGRENKSCSKPLGVCKLSVSAQTSS